MQQKLYIVSPQKNWGCNQEHWNVVARSKKKVRHHREQYLRHLVVVCDGNRTLLTGKVARNHVFTLQDWGVL